MTNQNFIKKILDKLSSYYYIIIIMKTLQVGKFKSKFSEILKDVSQGEDVAVTYGKKKEKIAVLVSFDKYKKKNKRKLGLLKNKASFKINDDFEINDNELLDL